MKKKLFIGLAVILAIGGVAGLWGYKYFLGTDEKLRSQLQEELSENFFYFGEADLEGNVAEGEGIAEVHNEEDQQEAESAPETSLSPQDQETKNTEITKEVIADNYRPRLERLEATALERIDVLFQRAHEEYNQQKAEGKVNKTQLARKYLQAAAMLEESVEGRFNELLKEMETELLQNQLPTDLVKEARDQYDQAIKQKKTSMFSKLEGLI
ncbi:hypothetical protein [Clostridium formicaceticum]|uniref:Uncharacterized protein n=1 Tax=Clostridium formicaceticum TaxID=1497 RepID=A0AAC9RI58_9CLOT|nr:hypothetical protein [Clostridium formicaceticum]AOY75626.1 hypothetical protein BJL90_06800 [Clostridium formicaceticum]ARE85937.1 hypothetical protein CLFO_02530 [Clostridium formicaceticum]